MTSFSTLGETIHLAFAPSVQGHPCDSAGRIPSETGCLIYNHGQMSSSEVCLTEISEDECTQLQQLIPAHVEVYSESPEEPGDTSLPAIETAQDATGSTAISLLTATQAVDLSSSANEHRLMMSGEKTPPSHGVVPGYVLDRVNNEDSPYESQTSNHTALLMQARSSVRVCLEKRFNSISDATPTQQDIQSLIPTNLLPMLQPSVETQETAVHHQMQNMMNTEGANSLDISKSFVGVIFNPVTNMFEEVVRRIFCTVEPQHQGLSQNFSFDQSVTVDVTADKRGGNNAKEEQKLVKTENDAATSTASSWTTGSTQRSQITKAAKTAPDSTGMSGRDTRKKTFSRISYSQRREIHNFRERDRRKKIRSCCDELNMLVPFCNSDSDKATTLQWTTAFLRYINATYGGVIREEFQKSFANENRVILNSSSSSVQNGIKQDVEETLTASLALEQSASQ